MGLVNLEKRNAVAHITLNRPEALNALNKQMLEELEKAVVQVGADPCVRCLILTGSGKKSFVAGADIEQMKDFDETEAFAFSQYGSAVFSAMENLEIPVIAAVNGYAFGGGCELALACDLRIASENAVFAQPETGLGITPGFGGTQRLPRLVGIARAKELLFTGRRVNAEEALKIGLVNKIVHGDSLMDEAFALAEEISQKAPVAIAQCKKSIGMGIQERLEKGLSLESEHFKVCFHTVDQKQRMSLFSEKRKRDQNSK